MVMRTIITDTNKINDILTRGVVDAIVRDSIKKKLLSGRRLRVKHGIDPTGPKIHLGRASTLRRLAKFQELGHKIVLIIGDFTAQIGDASDKDEERPMLTSKQVKENMRSYLTQISRIIDVKKLETRYNSEWLSKLNYHDVCRQADVFSVAQILDRENFSKRFRAGERISLRETLYPLMQGYDSVAVKADIEIGGSDQLFNVLAGRDLQKAYGQKPQDIITYKLMEGTDGRKMSTSWGNVIFIADDPENMYGQIMSVKDELIPVYFELCTDVDMDRIRIMNNEIKHSKVNPRDLKMKLAREIVGIYHGARKAEEAEDYFIKTVQKKEAPDEIKTMEVAPRPSAGLNIKSMNIVDLLIEVKLANSKNEARRLVQQGGVRVGGKVVSSISAPIKLTKQGVVIQRGKRNFIKAVITAKA